MKTILQRSPLWLFLYLQIFTTFHEVYSAVSTCNVRLRESSGTFTSPNYLDLSDEPKKTGTPSSHLGKDGLLACKWEIEVPPGKGIQLNFGDFDMKAKLDDCDSGEVEVFSGIGKKKSGLDKYCPGNNPMTVTLLNNTATVIFRRPSTFDGRGFLISYIATSPGETVANFVTCTDTGEIHMGVESFSVMCPSGCAGIQNHGVWGSLKYRDNSHLCRAAVHAGVISDEFGGRVAVRRKSGTVLYYGSIANNVSAETGPMSDSLIDFPALQVCHGDIDIRANQLSASSYWNTTDEEGRIQVWHPRKAILTGSLEAWSPDDYTKTQWLQVDLGKVLNITAIVTKGSSQPYSYTRSFTIKYSLNNITWHSYKEKRHHRAKVFTGNNNFFGRVRNNFVEPTIVARHVRVYPTAIPTQEDEHLRYGLKLGLQGCEPVVPVPIPSPLPEPRRFTTPTPAPTLPISTTPYSEQTPVETVKGKGNKETMKPDNSPSDGHTTNSTDVMISGDQPEKPLSPINTNPGSGSEKSIIIIGVVAALAVTTLLLATCVLILFRKRKKEPKTTTFVAKTNSQTNATYNAEIGMNFLNCNNNEDSKKQKKIERNRQQSQNMQFKNDNYKDSYRANGVSRHNSAMNPRSEATLQYDQQHMQHAVNGNAIARKVSTAPVGTSYPTNNEIAGPSTLLMGGYDMRHEDSGSFSSDCEDHEYQIIPDPVEDYKDHINNSSSKASTGSSVGARSKVSDSHPWQQGAMWGTAGDAWGKEFPPERGQVPSYPPQTRFNGRSGTMPHPIQFPSHGEEVDPLISPGPRTAPPCTNFTAPKFSNRKRNGSQSPPKFCTSGQQTGYSAQRYSTSSGNSSSHSPFDGSSGQQRYDPSATYYASVPEAQENGMTNGDVHPSQQVNPLYQPSQPSRKPSYQFSNGNPPGSPSFTTISNGNSSDYGTLDESTSYANGSAGQPGLRHSNSRSDSINQKKLRNGYDHLYRNKAIPGPENGKCVVAMTMNDYNQLDLTRQGDFIK